MNKTFIPSTNYNKRKWYVIDCKDKQLGRLASSIVPLLTGKTKSIYHPSLDVGDYVILINSEELNNIGLLCSTPYKLAFSSPSLSMVSKVPEYRVYSVSLFTGVKKRSKGSNIYKLLYFINN